MEVFQEEEGFLTIIIDNWNVQWFSEKDYIIGYHNHGAFVTNNPIWRPTLKEYECPVCEEIFPYPLEKFKTMVSMWLMENPAQTRFTFDYSTFYLVSNPVSSDVIVSNFATTSSGNFYVYFS